MINIILETNISRAKRVNLFYEKSIIIKKRCHKAKPRMSYIGALGTKKILEETN